MDAHRLSANFESATYGIVGGMVGALTSGIRESRIRAAQEQANDHAGASLIATAVAGAHADVATTLRIQLIGAEAQIANLTRQLDDAADEKAELIKMASELLEQNIHLARLH
jgi:sulfite exporter TauE/SafE